VIAWWRRLIWLCRSRITRSCWMPWRRPTRFRSCRGKHPNGARVGGGNIAPWNGDRGITRNCARPTTIGAPHARDAVSRENCATKARNRQATVEHSNGNLRLKAASERRSGKGAAARARFTNAGTARRARTTRRNAHGKANARQMPRVPPWARGGFSVWMPNGRAVFS